jgi:hypothetical protein
MPPSTRMLSAPTMTAQRQQRHHGSHWPLFRRGLTLFALLAGLVAQVLAAQAATTERIVTNRFSGLAIGGYDPVSYFVDGQPVLGVENFEAWQGGVVWRFRNDDNRSFFLAHPEIYGPQFGGYDPIDVARGVAVPGNPRLWFIADERLFLFSREASRDAFAAHPERYLQRATSRWQTLEQELPRY